MEELGIQYLSKAAEADSQEIIQASAGLLRDREPRAIVLLAVSHEDGLRWIFRVESGAQLACLSALACRTNA